MRHYKITISGKVQGVYFRASAKAKAAELQLCGLVKNMPNGDVYIEAEGTDEGLEAFIAWCHQGPPFARVENVDIEEADYTGMKCFEVKR